MTLDIMNRAVDKGNMTQMRPVVTMLMIADLICTLTTIASIWE